MLSEKKELTKEELRAILLKVAKKTEEYMKTPEGRKELDDYCRKYGTLTAKDLMKRFTI